MKENGDDTKKWKDIPCSLIGRIIIIKMSIQPEAILLSPSRHSLGNQMK